MAHNRTATEPTCNEEFVPSPSQIRRGCRRIRESWDSTTLLERNVYYSNWIAPMCRQILHEEFGSWQP